VAGFCNAHPVTILKIPNEPIFYLSVQLIQGSMVRTMLGTSASWQPLRATTSGAILANVGVRTRKPLQELGAASLKIINDLAAGLFQPHEGFASGRWIAYNLNVYFRFGYFSDRLINQIERLIDFPDPDHAARKTIARGFDDRLKRKLAINGIAAFSGVGHVAATPQCRANGALMHKHRLSKVTPIPESLRFTDPSFSKTLVISRLIFSIFLSSMVMLLSFSLSMFLRTPPTLQDPKMTRPPVVSSIMSSSASRTRHECMNRLSKPKASAARPSHSRWL
jgi:hypothetical protein